MQIEENLLYGNGDKAYVQSVDGDIEPAQRVAEIGDQLFEEIDKTNVPVERGALYLKGCLELLSKTEPFQNGEIIITDGANDYGFDAFFIERPDADHAIIYGIQSKLGGNSRDLKKDFNKKTKLLMRPDSISPNKKLQPLINLLKSGKIKKLNYVQYIFIEDSDRTPPTDKNKEQIKNIFQSEVVDVIEDIDKRIVFESIKILTHSDVGLMAYGSYDWKLKVPYVKGKFYEDPSEEGSPIESYSGQVKIKDLLEGVLEFDYMEYLQQANVRNYLGEENSTNIGIERSLLEAPQEFPTKHGGITLVGAEYDATTGVLRDPKIINGGQSINKLLDTYKNHKHANAEAFETTIEVRIVISDDPDHRLRLAAATNNHSPIELWHLLSVDPAMARLTKHLRCAPPFSTSKSKLEKIYFSSKRGEDPMWDSAVKNSKTAELSLLDALQRAYIIATGSPGEASKKDRFALDGENTKKLKEKFGDFDSLYYVDITKMIAILKYHGKAIIKKYQTSNVFKETYRLLFFAISFRLIMKHMRFKHRQKRGHDLVKCFLKEYMNGSLKLEPILQLSYVAWRRYLKSGYVTTDEEGGTSTEGWWRHDSESGFGGEVTNQSAWTNGHMRNNCNGLYDEDYVGNLRGLWSSLREVGNLIERKGIHEAVKIINKDPNHEDYFLFHDEFNVLKKDKKNIPVKSSTDIIDVSGDNNDGKVVWFDGAPGEVEETETNV